MYAILSYKYFLYKYVRERVGAWYPFQARVTRRTCLRGDSFFGFTPPDILDAVREFEVRDDDVFLATYPKAGKTETTACI